MSNVVTLAFLLPRFALWSFYAVQDKCARPFAKVDEL
jgi:hypothetical protein